MSSESFPQSPESEKNRRSYEEMRAYISEITRGSSYAHEKDRTGVEHITSPEGERFGIRHITDPNDSAVEKIHAAMVKEFGEEEAEALYWIRESIAAKKNAYHVVEDADGNIISLSNTQYLRYHPEAQPSRAEAVAYVAHVWTDAAHRGKGLIKELYRSFLGSAVERAEREGAQFKAVIGEAMDAVEGLLNKLGRKRLYFEDGGGAVHELPYLCPPVDMDSATGERVEDPFPEHFMVRLANDAQTIHASGLLELVKSVYEEYIGQPSDYASPVAYETSRRYVYGLLDELAGALRAAKDGILFMMSKEEREKAKETLSARGKQLVEVET